MRLRRKAVKPSAQAQGPPVVPPECYCYLCVDFDSLILSARSTMCDGQNTIIFRLHDDGQTLVPTERIRRSSSQNGGRAEASGCGANGTACRQNCSEAQEPTDEIDEIAIYARLIADSKE